jgi:putative phosphoribosyl transferase
VRKLGVPGHEEYALGAIASGGLRVLQQAVVRKLHLSPAALQQLIDREQAELERRALLYRDGAPPPRIAGRIVIVADDGLATGSTMRVAIEAVRHQKPAQLIVAVPVAAPEARDRVGAEVDEMVCLVTPPLFRAVSEWYAHFEQTTDEEVQALLAAPRRYDHAARQRAQELVPYLTR